MQPANGKQLDREFRVWGFVLTAALLPGCACNPAEDASVYPEEAPIISQEGGYWCWAASGQMILAHLGVSAPQCDQANRHFGLAHCCGAAGTVAASPLDSKCDNGAFPQFEKYGYSARSTQDSELSWKQIQKQIACRKRPFAFSWHYKEGGGHMMVAVEYQTDGPSQLVCRVDPAAEDYDCIPYQYYVAGSDHSHWNDLYDFELIGPEDR
jgi:peptidase C39-like protein